jgi:hypothetical protein
MLRTDEQLNDLRHDRLMDNPDINPAEIPNIEIIYEFMNRTELWAKTATKDQRAAFFASHSSEMMEALGLTDLTIYEDLFLRSMSPKQVLRESTAAERKAFVWVVNEKPDGDLLPRLMHAIMMDWTPEHKQKMIDFLAKS